MKGRLWLFLLLALWLAVPAQAEMADEFGAESVKRALPEEASATLGEYSPLDGDTDGALSRLWTAALEKAVEHLRSLMRPAAGMMAVVTLAAWADGMVEKRKGIDYVNLCACLALAAVCLGDVRSVLALSRETISAVSDFSRVLLPSLSTAAVAAGAVTAAPAKYAASMLFLDALMALSSTVLYPLLCVYLAAVLAEAALGEGRLGGATRLLRWICKSALVLLVSAFVLYLSVSGTLSGAADAAAAKAAKTALSTALPVVGRILSDAADSLVAGAGMVRNALGVFGLLGLLAMCLSPFLAIAARYLLFKAAAALSAVVSGERLCRLIDGIGTVFALLLGLVGAQIIFLYVSILSLMKAVSA